MKSVAFQHYSMMTGEKHGREWFDWCIFVSSPRDVVKSIFCVEYTLHPTFPNPNRTVEKKASRFALISSGWGGFPIEIRIAFEDSSISHATHFLNLDTDSWPKGPTLADADPDVIRTYRLLFHPKYRWRQLSTIIEESGVPRLRAVAILEDLVRKNFVRRSHVRSLSNEEMFGATAVVGLMPSLDT